MGTGLLFFNQLNPASPEQGIRVKGQVNSGPQLTLYRHNGDRVEPLSDGSFAAQGDLIQIGYKGVSENTYGLILSLDGSGNQTLHFPMSGEEAQLLEAGAEVFLPWSYELDNAPDYEAFFLILSPEPFELKDISAAALLKERVPRGVEVYGFMVTK